MEEYPREFRVPPLLLAALVGAQPLHARLTDHLHKAAVAASKQRRVKFLSWEDKVLVPPCKRGGKDVPDYRPDGLVKRHWVEKVCGEVPGVLVFCLDWSTAGQPSSGDEAEAVSRLQQARQQTLGRDLRLLVFVLLHGNVADPEVACATLRQQPEASGLVIARGEADIPARAPKLERLIFQTASSFYGEEEKRHRRVRTPHPGSPQWAQHALQIRANFKVGFLCEFRKDARSALKSYIKAYEQLIHDVEVASMMERMALCNHITIRMYQLYLQSHDVGAAVHHCRIHAATLKSCLVDDTATAWRRWHWLAVNHQLFAELLENVAQQVPNLIDPADMWQFSGFHYRSAAYYVEQLQRWALTTTGTHNSEPPQGAKEEEQQTGGCLVDAPYIGQPQRLERPGDCVDPIQVAAVRIAYRQAVEVRQGDRSLQLLARAQAAYKERGFRGGVAACSARMADEYMRGGNYHAAGTLYRRLYQGNGRPVWPAIRRVALQRSLLCSFREFGIDDLPSLASACTGSPVMPTGEAAAPGEEGEPGIAARQQLVRNALDYLGFLAEDHGEASPPGRAAQDLSDPRNVGIAEEVLSALRRILEDGNCESSEEPPEVRFRSASGLFEFHESPEGSGPRELVVSLNNPLQVSLHIAGAVASTSHGNVVLCPDSGIAGDGCPWSCENVLDMRGRWENLSDGVFPDAGATVSTIRVTLKEAPGMAILVAAVPARGPSPGKALLPPFRLPAVGNKLGPLSLDRALDRLGAFRGQSDRSANPGVVAEIFSPVDPATAIAMEHFIFHVVVRATVERTSQPLEGVAPSRLFLSYHAELLDPRDNQGDVLAPSVSLLCGDPGAGVSLLQLDDGDLGTFVAESASDGTIQRGAAGVMSLRAEDLQGGPLQWTEGENLLVIPVVVRYDHQCRLLVSGRLRGADAKGQTVWSVAVPPVTLQFRPALHVSFEGRAAGGPGLRPVVAGLPRRFSLKSTSPSTVQVKTMTTATEPGHEPDTILGAPGRIEPGASHAFALLPGTSMVGGGKLVVCFDRPDAVATFFPWAQCRATLPAAACPSVTCEWPIPAGSTLPAAPVLPQPSSAQLGVVLEHAETGIVFEPVEVRVRVRCAAVHGGAQELRVRALLAEAGDALDKFVLSGPTSTQAVILPTDTEEEVSQVCARFALVPLKPGWVHLPRVAVSDGGQEATTAPCSIFVFPSAQPAHFRSPA